MMESWMVLAMARHDDCLRLARSALPDAPVLADQPPRWRRLRAATGAAFAWLSRVRRRAVLPPAAPVLRVALHRHRDDAVQ